MKCNDSITLWNSLEAMTTTDRPGLTPCPICGIREIHTVAVHLFQARLGVGARFFGGNWVCLEGTCANKSVWTLWRVYFQENLLTVLVCLHIIRKKYSNQASPKTSPPKKVSNKCVFFQRKVVPPSIPSIPIHFTRRHSAIKWLWEETMWHHPPTQRHLNPSLRRINLPPPRWPQPKTVDSFWWLNQVAVFQAIWKFCGFKSNWIISPGMKIKDDWKYHLENKGTALEVWECCLQQQTTLKILKL